jgi:hypothetical protein
LAQYLREQRLLFGAQLRDRLLVRDARRAHFGVLRRTQLLELLRRVESQRRELPRLLELERGRLLLLLGAQRRQLLLERRDRNEVVLLLIGDQRVVARGRVLALRRQLGDLRAQLLGGGGGHLTVGARRHKLGRGGGGGVRRGVQIAVEEKIMS